MSDFLTERRLRRRATRGPRLRAALQNWRRWFFLVAWIAVGVEIPSLSEPREVLATLVIGLVVGVLWQTVYRRDLVERLFPVTVMLAVALLLALGLPGAEVTVEPSNSMSAVGIVMGLVLTEWGFRRRDRTA